MQTHAFRTITFKPLTPPPLQRDLSLDTNATTNITSAMATQTATSGICATCSQPATTRCAGCAATEHNGAEGGTLYCGKTCQTTDWTNHKAACQSVQGRRKLFRAAEVIQDAFFALKTEIFDFNLDKVERTGDGKIHFFNSQFDMVPFYGPAAACLNADVELKRAVLSYPVGGDLFHEPFYGIVVRAFKGNATPNEQTPTEQCTKPSRRLHH